MRSILLLSALSLLFYAFASSPAPSDAQPVAAPSSPQLTIKSIVKPAKRGEPLRIDLSVTTLGSTPVALSKSQFTIRIGTANKPGVWGSEIEFVDQKEEIIRVAPGTTKVVAIRTLADRSGAAQWDMLPPGRYEVRVYVNSGKSQEFADQWLGQAYSKEYPLEID